MTEPHIETNLSSDDELAQRSLIEREAFSALYRRYLARVYRFCSSKVSTVQEAEDLTGQVFLDALRALPRYHPQGHFAAWLFAIARRRTADHYRGGPPPLELLDTLPAPILTDPYGDRERLNALLARLPSADLDLLRLRYAAMLDYAEIGRVLGRTPNAVKMTHHRLLHKLRACWEDDHD